MHTRAFLVWGVDHWYNIRTTALLASTKNSSISGCLRIVVVAIARDRSIAERIGLFDGVYYGKIKYRPSISYPHIVYIAYMGSIAFEHNVKRLCIVFFLLAIWYSTWIVMQYLCKIGQRSWFFLCFVYSQIETHANIRSHTCMPVT